MARYRSVLLLLIAVALAGCRSRAEQTAPAASSGVAPRPPEPPALDLLIVASVEGPVRAAARTFQTRKPGVVLRFELATPALIRAHLGGEPRAEVVVTEGELTEAARIVPGSVRRIGQSALFAVRSRRADEIKTPAELPKASFPHFVLPDPAHNASGAAAKAWLAATRAGQTSLLDALEPRLLPQRDASAALAELERRGRTMGVLLAIDLGRAKTVKPLFELPGEPIPFTAAVVQGPERELAAAFVALLAEHGLDASTDGGR